jgi:hypothetical protein
VFREDGTALHETRPSLPLEGERTPAGFCDHLAALELWPEPPEWDVALRFRNWAFESAALDLALRQAARSLHDVLGLEPRPVRFVNSLGLGKVPSMEPVGWRRPRLGAVGHTSPRPSRAPASSEQRGSQDARADPNAGLEVRAIRVAQIASAAYGVRSAGAGHKGRPGRASIYRVIWRPAVAEMVGEGRPWTVLMISLLSMPCR